MGEHSFFFEKSKKMSTLRNRRTSTGSDSQSESTLQKPANSKVSKTRHNDKRIINFAAAFVFLAQAVMFYMASFQQPINIPLTRSTWVLKNYVPVLETSTFINVDVNKSVSFYFATAGTHHLLLVLPGIFGWYTRQIDSGFGVHRWIEYAFSASTMTGVLALAVGFRDVFTVALLIGNLLVTQIFGFLVEYEMSKGIKRPAAFYLAWIPYAFAWTPILYQYYSVVTSGNGDVYSDQFHTMLPAMFAGFTMFGVLQGLQIHGFLGEGRAEYAYVLLSILDKTGLGLALMLGVIF